MAIMNQPEKSIKKVLHSSSSQLQAHLQSKSLKSESNPASSWLQERSGFEPVGKCMCLAKIRNLIHCTKPVVENFSPKEVE